MAPYYLCTDRGTNTLKSTCSKSHIASKQGQVTNSDSMNLGAMFLTTVLFSFMEVRDQLETWMQIRDKKVRTWPAYARYKC